MDVLKNKSYKSYNRLSRYSEFPTYYNSLFKKYEVSSMSWLKDDTDYVLHTVVVDETYDSISLKYYNNPTYYWIICSYNRITDPFSNPILGSTLKIPVLSYIDFEG